MKAPPKLRLFVGIAADDAVRAAVSGLQDALRKRGVEGRFEPPDKAHLTVAFLGNVERERLDAVRAALSDAAAECWATSLTLDRIGAFPNVRRPRVVWLGPAKQPATLTTIYATVRERLSMLGFSFEKDAVAHVTICRDARAAPGFADAGVSEPAVMKIGGLTLFQSMPVAGGTRYEILASFPLRS